MVGYLIENIRKMQEYRLYINLSNGIDFLKQEKSNNLVRFIRIPSTWCESKQWGEILFTLSDDLLMHLALGYHCIILDTSSRNRIPRALWQGIEWIKFVLYKIWFNKDYIPEGRAKAGYKYFLEQYKKIPKFVKKKIKYYKDFLMTEELRISCKYRQTDIDGNKEKMKEILKEYLNVFEKH